MAPRISGLSRRGAVGLGPDYRRLWTAGALSNLGDGVYLGALPLLASTLSRDPFEISLVVAASWLPWLLIGVVSGAVADRGNRLRIMVWVDLVRFVVLGALALVAASGAATIAVLIAAALVLGTAQTLFDSAGQAVIPVIVGRRSEALMRANSQIAASQTIGKDLAGPPAGSALFTAVPFLPFLLDAVSYLASALLLRGVRGPAESVRDISGGRASIRADAVAGLRWLVGQRVVLSMAVVVGLSNVAWISAEAVLVLFAQDRLGVGPLWFGALLAAPAVGAVPGTLVAGAVLRHVRPGVIFLGGLLLQAVIVAGIGLSTDPIVVAGLLAVGGLVITLWNIAQTEQRQFLVPNRVMGRVVSSMRVIAYGTAPIGAVVGGAVASGIGLSAPFYLAAIVLVLATVVAAPYLNTRSLQQARDEVGEDDVGGRRRLRCPR